MATQFPLKFTAGSAQSLEELAEVFDSIALIGYYKDGRLIRWLEAWYYPDEANAVKNVDASQKDDDLLLSLVKILGFSEQQIKAGDQRSPVTQQIDGKTCEQSSTNADHKSASETVVTNIDGCKISWDIQPASPPPNMDKIVRCKGKFVGITYPIDDNRSIFFSEDGISWSLVKRLGDSYGAQLVVVNDYIVVLNFAVYLFSKDGKTWQSVEPHAFVINILWNGDQYILHGTGRKIYNYGKKSWLSDGKVGSCHTDVIFISKSLDGPWKQAEGQPYQYRSSQSSTWFQNCLYLPEVLDLEAAERLNLELKVKNGLNSTKDFKSYKIFKIPFEQSELDPLDLVITNNSKHCFLICSQDALVESGNPTAYYYEDGWHPMQENFIALRASEQILVGKTTENKFFFSVNGIDWKEFEFPPKNMAMALDGKKIYCVLKDGFAVGSITPEK